MYRGKGYRGKSHDGNKQGIPGLFFIFVTFAVWMAAAFWALPLPLRAAQEEHPATGPDWSIDASSAPEVVAESAMLIDVDTGVSLYEKNIHVRRYPASITKLLTCLLAMENSELTETVTFSHDAVYGIERGSSNIGIDEGEQLSMEDCLYATLLESANEVAAGIAEHVGGSAEGFSRMMNDKVRELGGNDSNFVNANGLPDDNHYTSAYDMALIARAFFQDETLSEISGTVFHHIYASPTQKDEIDLRNHHRMLPGCQLGNRHTYEYTVGGKTGYTDVARQTLVTCAEKDGHRLVCVILKDETPNHYLDSIALFDYGFACYEKPEVLARIEESALALNPPGEEAAEDMPETDVENAQVISGETEQKAGGGDSALIDSGNDKTGQETRGKSGFPVLAAAVIAVVLTAAGVCGFFFCRAYRQEQERKRRRAEIMARHRARKRQAERDDWQSE